MAGVDEATLRFISATAVPDKYPIAPTATAGFASFRHADDASTLQDILIHPCSTSAGRTMLSSWMRAPSIDARTISSRHAIINYLLCNPDLADFARRHLLEDANHLQIGAYHDNM
jgi:hypothetical protein